MMEYVNLIEKVKTKYPRVTGVFSAFTETYDPAFDFAGEKHDFWEAVCVLSGNAVITADALVYRLGADEVIFHKPMRFHKIAADGEPLRVVIFSFAAEGDMTAFENGVFRISRGARVLAEEIAKLSEQCADEEAAQLLINRIEQFLLTVRSGERLLAEQGGGAAQFNTIVTAMETHIREKLSVDDLAALCCLSPANMKKIFYRYTGTGIIKYFNGLKAERAAAMLREGKRIVEISDALGFDNQNYFSTVFKREKGCSPSAYRKKFR